METLIIFSGIIAYLIYLIIIIIVINGENDDIVEVNSKQAYNNYDELKYLKEHRDFIDDIKYRIENKDTVEKDKFTILVRYTTPSSKIIHAKILSITYNLIQDVKNNPSLTMSKKEINEYVKEQRKYALEDKQHIFYDKVNAIIDYANSNKAKMINKEYQTQLDQLIFNLYDRAINTIKKIKTVDSEEWGILSTLIRRTNIDVLQIVSDNQQILDYYFSEDFYNLKNTCQKLMSSQKEFNEYINDKAQSIASLFGTRIVRNETISNDTYEYIRPYKKAITPFTAELSSSVFASAENNPLEYIVKYFYPNKDRYPEQIEKLHTLIEELETLNEAKLIIQESKESYREYLANVPDYVLKNDEAGFYSRLGFANIDESTLTVQYKFSYTSDGGMAQRSFTVPMTEPTIIELINILENKLTMSAFAKEQRILMTKKLRQYIKERDNYTCRSCGNSTHKEPNLLLEIDHIIPVAKGGLTEESNLQTLCWRCNRSKSDKLIY